MLSDLTAGERVLIVMALREFARLSAERAEKIADASPRLAQMDRDDATTARELIAKVRA